MTDGSVGAGRGIGAEKGAVRDGDRGELAINAAIVVLGDGDRGKRLLSLSLSSTEEERVSCRRWEGGPCFVTLLRQEHYAGHESTSSSVKSATEDGTEGRRGHRDGAGEPGCRRDGERERG